MFYSNITTNIQVFQAGIKMKRKSRCSVCSGRGWTIENQRFKPCDCVMKEKRRKEAEKKNTKRVKEAHNYD